MPIAEDDAPRGAMLTDEEVKEYLGIEPLAEEEEAPQYDEHPLAVPANNPTHRRLRAIAGAEIPYLFLTFPPNGQVSLDFWGIDPATLPGVLRQVAQATSQ